MTCYCFVPEYLVVNFTFSEVIHFERIFTPIIFTPKMSPKSCKPIGCIWSWVEGVLVTESVTHRFMYLWLGYSSAQFNTPVYLTFSWIKTQRWILETKAEKIYGGKKGTRTLNLWIRSPHQDSLCCIHRWPLGPFMWKPEHANKKWKLSSTRPRIKLWRQG